MTTQPIRDKKQVRELAGYYLRRGETRNHLLIVMGVHTALRISDLLSLRWDDAYDFSRDCVRACVTVTESKTGKTKTIALNNAVKHALGLCIASASAGDFLFKSHKGDNRAISRVQAYRIVRTASESAGLARASCHSLRKTFGYHLWRAGVSPAVIMEVYNHSSFAVTRRYLGVTQDDMNDAYFRLEEMF